MSEANSSGDWDPGQYERFSEQRAQPFWDLAGLVDRSAPIEQMVDLGCGTGVLTAELVDRLGAADAVGVDDSPAMLDKASAHGTEQLRFVEADIGSWTSAADHDLVFSNAALHWLPDHEEVLASWRDALRSGGQLAVQVPFNADHPAPRAAVRAAEREPFLSALGGDPPPDAVTANVLAPSRYAEVLYGLGFEAQSVRMQVYGHVLPSNDAVIEWIRGSTLTRFFRRLPDSLHEPFVDAVRREYSEVASEREPVFYPFKRILMWARLPS